MQWQRPLSLLLFFFFILAACSQVFPQFNPSGSKSYQQGLQFYREGKVGHAIDAFKSATKKDRSFADAYHKLGLAYMKIGSVESRRQATLAFKEALKLDRMNIEYHLDMGKLSLKKQMKGEAKKCFEMALKIDSSTAEAYYHLGILKEEEMLWYKDMISPQAEGIVFTFEKYANEDLRDAKRFFQKAIESDQTFAPAYYHLALLECELSEYSAMAEHLKKALTVQPENKDFYLFLGLANHRMGDNFAANQNFDLARLYMSSDELALYESPASVLDPEKSRRYAVLNAINKNDYEREFWKQRDPLFMTEFNERVLEHYSRFAYANLRFGNPDKGIIGWKTDQGKAYIRFGRPDSKVRTRPRISSTLNSSGYPVVPAKENWRYADFDLTFEDRTLNSHFKFERHIDPDQDSKLVFEQLIKRVPEAYELDIRGSYFEIVHVITQYMGEDGKTKITLDFGIPRDKVGPSYGNVFIKNGLFVFDADWNHFSKKIENRRLPLGDKLDSKQSPVIIDRHEIQLSPDSYKIALELLDEATGNIGRVRRELDVRKFNPNRLEISDLLLADDIEAGSSPEGRIKNLKISPNLYSRFLAGQAIFVYFEAYNLELNQNGFSHYSVETILRPLKNRRHAIANFFSGVGKIFGFRDSKGSEVSTIYEYQGNSTMEPTYSSVRLADTKPGEYLLLIRVRDINGNKTAENKIKFEIRD